MAGKEKKPGIRFTGFTDAWEQRKLDFLSEKVSVGIATSSSKYFIDKEMGIPFIKNQDIKNGVIDASNLEAITPEFDERNKTKRLLPGDIITVRTGNPGLSAVVPENLAGAQTFTTLITRLKSTDVSSEYVVSFINSEAGMSQINGMQAGGAQKNVNANTLKSLLVSFPFKDEQVCIYRFFNNIDNLITLHQRKYDKLIIIKKSMLEKMFPKNGANVPEIRFAGFTEVWEQRQALKIFESTADKNHSDLPVLSATQEFGMIKRDDTGINISHDKKNEMTYKRVLPGQFVIHLRSFQGGFAHSAIEGITSPAYTVFGFKEVDKHCDYFWKYIFKSEVFIKRLETVTYGIRDGRSINYSEFITMPFYYPDYKEQRKIADFFTHLDHLITLNQRKLEKLKNIKKSLLEKMFV